MAYRSTVQCDACGVAMEAPADGGFPAGWAEINRKPSLRGPEQMEKRKRLHLCELCFRNLIQPHIKGD